MSPWHSECADERCYLWCQRPGCLEPGRHFLAKSARQGNAWVSAHIYECTIPQSVVRTVVEDLHPGMGPEEIAIARRVLAEALDRLEKLEKPRPSIYKETA